MILKGSQRAGAAHLAAHLLNNRDNDHVTVQELRGFVADDLYGALRESHAIAQGTKCKQHLFSLSLNPPQEAVLDEEAFERAANACEERLGLSGQPRVLIIHEKEGRRHAHVVWSRIKADEMRAVNMAHFKTKLTGLSKELYLEHGWELPKGLQHMGGKSPLNFTLAEWQQAKRLELDPREIKQVFQQAYKQSDGLKAFAAALEERGYFIAKGDRRGFVAVDVNGNVFSLSRYLGVKTKEFRERMGATLTDKGNGEDLRPVHLVSAELHNKLTAQLRTYLADEKQAQQTELRPLKRRVDQLTAEHKAQRTHLEEKQSARQESEKAMRARRLRKGLLGIWDKLTGKAAALHKQNQLEAWQANKRDSAQRDALIRTQLAERRKVQERIDKMRRRHIDERADLHRELIQRMKAPEQEQAMHARRLRPRRGFTLDR